MIDFRYHLVSIVAVFLALAIGIVLGAAELQGPAYSILNHTTAKLQDELDQANGQLSTVQRDYTASEAYAAAVEPAVLRGLLSGQRLLIVTEPGADPAVVSGISTAAADAGASVTGQVNLQASFFATSGAALDTLGQVNQDVAAQAGISLAAGTSDQQQAAQVIAQEILVKAAGSAGSAAGSTQATDAQTMLQAYAGNGFLATAGQPAAQATLAVVVTPQDAPADGIADPVGQMLVPLARELAAHCAATVVAGSAGGSGAGSPIAVLRASSVSSRVSSVDDADLVSGQSAVIQALAALLRGAKAGSYGLSANGASSAAPSPVPTPSTSASAGTTPTARGKKK